MSTPPPAGARITREEEARWRLGQWDDGASLRLLSALTAARAVAEALEPTAAMLRVIAKRLDRLDGGHTPEIDTILAIARSALAAFRERVEE